MSHFLATDKDKHPKQDFQVERLAFFSDAVFAIAITLLVIEFKVPHVTKETTYAELWHEVKELKYQFLSLVLSFAIIANYWLKHHLLFKHIHNYTNRILRLNLMVLLPIIFFPFTTAFVYESVLNEAILVIPFRLFIINNIAASFSMYFLYWQVIIKHPHLSYTMNAEDKIEFTNRLFLTGVCFVLLLILTFFLKLEVATFISVMPLLYSIYYKKIKKRFTK